MPLTCIAPAGLVQSLLVLAQDETEIGELTKSKEFTQQHGESGILLFC